MNQNALAVVASMSLVCSASAGAFTLGNLIVSRYGDGSATLSSAATNVAILEYARTGGVAVQTITFPGTGANQVTDSGSASSNGYINSYNGFVTLPGYNTATGTASVASTNTKVGTVLDGSGNVVSRTAFPTGGAAGTPASPFSGNNFRSMIATGANTFYATGTASGSPNTGGAWYYNGANFTQVSSTATGQPTNLRNVEIYNNQLYVSSSTGSFIGISSIGSGLPTGAGQTVTLQINMGSNASPYGFVMFDTNADGALDLAYIADDRTATGGGLQKWTMSGGTWTQSWALLVNATGGLSAASGAGFAGLRGLTGTFENGVATLYATTTETSNNRIVSIADSGITPVSATNLASAGANYVFRGVDLSIPAPGALALLSVAGLLGSRRRR